MAGIVFQALLKPEKECREQQALLLYRAAKRSSSLDGLASLSAWTALHPPLLGQRTIPLCLDGLAFLSPWKLGIPLGFGRSPALFSDARNTAGMCSGLSKGFRRQPETQLSLWAFEGSPKHSWYTWQPCKSLANACQELRPARPWPKRDWPTLARQRAVRCCGMSIALVGGVQCLPRRYTVGTRSSLADPPLTPDKR